VARFCPVPNQSPDHKGRSPMVPLPRARPDTLFDVSPVRGAPSSCPHRSPEGPRLARVSALAPTVRTSTVNMLPSLGLLVFLREGAWTWRSPAGTGTVPAEEGRRPLSDATDLLARSSCARVRRTPMPTATAARSARRTAPDPRRRPASSCIFIDESRPGKSKAKRRPCTPTPTPPRSRGDDRRLRARDLRQGQSVGATWSKIGPQEPVRGRRGCPPNR